MHTKKGGSAGEKEVLPKKDLPGVRSKKEKDVVAIQGKNDKRGLCGRSKQGEKKDSGGPYPPSPVLNSSERTGSEKTLSREDRSPKKTFLIL